MPVKDCIGYDSDSIVRCHFSRQPGTMNVDRGIPTWIEDYCTPCSVYNEAAFERCFGIPKSLFKKIEADMGANVLHHWSTQTYAVCRVGIYANLKIMTVLCVVTKCQTFYMLDDRVRMGEEKTRKYVHTFLDDAHKKYGTMYLNPCPTPEEMGNIEDLYDTSGLPGFVKSVYCCHIS